MPHNCLGLQKKPYIPPAYMHRAFMFGISLQIPEKINNFIKKLIDEDLLVSRSEFIRQCLFEGVAKYERILELCATNRPYPIRRKPPLGRDFEVPK